MNKLRQFLARIRFSRNESMALVTVFGLYMVGLTWRYVQMNAVPFDDHFYARIDSVTNENARDLIAVDMSVPTDTVPKPKRKTGQEEDEGEQRADSLDSDQAPGSSDQASGNQLHMDTGRLDINRATERQFTLLPGIGPSLAQRIVTYRKESGPFRNKSELLNVKGIGPKTLRKFEGMIVVE